MKTAQFRIRLICLTLKGVIGHTQPFSTNVISFDHTLLLQPIQYALYGLESLSYWLNKWKSKSLTFDFLTLCLFCSPFNIMQFPRSNNDFDCAEDMPGRG